MVLIYHIMGIDERRELLFERISHLESGISWKETKCNRFLCSIIGLSLAVD